jgi:hypothetical protein
MGVDEAQGNFWTVEDVAVLPGTVEDQVYYTVRTTGPQAQFRHLLKWAKEAEAVGGDNNYLADVWGQYTGAPTSSIDILADSTPPLRIYSGYLNGADVSIWADGADRGTASVVSGIIDLSSITGQPFSNVIWGNPYRARFKSAKLGTLDGIGLLERKKVNKIGFIAQHLHYQGLQYGPDFDNLSDLPLVEQGQDTPADTVWEDYHEDNFPFGGEWIPDSRICLQATSPRPATILAAIAEFESVEKRSNVKRRAPR